MTLNPAQNGFLKGLITVIVLAVASYLTDAGNLAPVVGVPVAAIAASLASALESHIRANTGKGLFGAATVT